MMFAQALARIEELLKELKSPDDTIWNKAHNELLHLCSHHASDIVQLARVAGEMRNRALFEHDSEAIDAAMEFDALMKKGEALTPSTNTEGVASQSSRTGGEDVGR